MSDLRTATGRPGWSSLDGSVYRWCRTISFYLVAGVLWIVASLPLVSVPPATTALHAALATYHRTGDVPRLATLLAVARRHAAASYRLAIALVVVFGLLAVDILIVGQSHQPLLLGGVFGLGSIAVVLLAQSWPALLRAGTARGALVCSARSAVRRPALALAAGCTWIIPWLSLRLVPPHWMVLAVVFLPATCAALSVHIGSLTGAGAGAGAADDGVGDDRSVPQSRRGPVTGGRRSADSQCDDDGTARASSQPARANQIRGALD